MQKSKIIGLLQKKKKKGWLSPGAFNDYKKKTESW